MPQEKLAHPKCGASDGPTGLPRRVPRQVFSILTLSAPCTRRLTNAQSPDYRPICRSHGTPSASRRVRHAEHCRRSSTYGHAGLPAQPHAGPIRRHASTTAPDGFPSGRSSRWRDPWIPTASSGWDARLSTSDGDAADGRVRDAAGHDDAPAWCSCFHDGSQCRSSATVDRWVEGVVSNVSRDRGCKTKYMATWIACGRV